MKGLKCFLLVLCGVSVLVTVATVLYNKMYRNMVLSFLRPDGDDILTPIDWDMDTIEDPTSFGEVDTQADV